MIGQNIENVFAKLSQYRFLIILILAASFLIFTNLDNMYLWKDEAGTSTVGYNTMLKGYPTIYDGKNLLSTSDGNNFNNKFLVTNHDWLQYYISAISFLILGKSTFAARVPFALFSIASVAVIWLLARKVFKRIKLVNLTTLTYLLNVQFLLYARQARYYSLVIFFTALSSLLLFKLIDHYKEKKILSKQKVIITYILYISSIVLLFFSNRLGGVVWLGAVGLYFIFLRSMKLLSLIIPTVMGSGIWGIWYLVNNIIFEAPEFGGSRFEIHMFTKMVIILWKIQAYFLPFICLIIFIILFQILNYIFKIRHKFIISEKIMFMIFLIMSNIIVVALPKWGIVNHYFLSLLIATPFLITETIRFISKSSKTLSVVVLLLIVFTNIFNILPYYTVRYDLPVSKNEVNNLLSDNYSKMTNYGLIASPVTDSEFRIQSLQDYMNSLKIRLYLFDFFQELVSDHDSSIEEIVNYLNRNAKSSDKVVVVGMEYEPIAFYTNVRIVNNLTTKLKPWPDYFSAYPNQAKYSKLTHVPDNEIDWVILKNDGSKNTFFDDPNFLEKNKSKFDIYNSKNVDIELSNSADIDYHKFVTVKEGSKFTIWRKK